MPAMFSPLALDPVIEVDDRDDREDPFEIIDGEKVYQPVSALAQQVGFIVAAMLYVHVKEAGLEVAVATEVYLACFDWLPDTKRRPDVSLWREGDYPNGLPYRGVATRVPAMCVEVVSPGDNAEALAEKVAEYFRAGVELVWTVSPATRTVRAEQPDGTAHAYRAADTITAAPVLPGFSAAVADFFPA